MKSVSVWLAASAMAVMSVPAFADNMATVRSFYDNLLTTPADATLEDVRSVVAGDWKSTPTPLGGPGAEGFHTTLSALGA